jgi:hypothetical protein
MRVDHESDRRDVPRWALWLVAAVCFGPLTLTWLLGVLFTPFWIGMLAALLAEPERFAHDPDTTIWVVALPIGLVIGGLLGLVGVVRLLTLPRQERPKSHRIFTVGMVAVGLGTALVFNQPFVEGEIFDLSEVISVAGLVYLMLPFAGATWLLAKSWRFLLAGPVRADVERREHRDDWRLDA